MNAASNRLTMVATLNRPSYENANPVPQVTISTTLTHRLGKLQAPRKICQRHRATTSQTTHSHKGACPIWGAKSTICAISSQARLLRGTCTASFIRGPCDLEVLPLVGVLRCSSQTVPVLLTPGADVQVRGPGEFPHRVNAGHTPPWFCQIPTPSNTVD